MTTFQKLYWRHYEKGLTGSYHGDMAATLDKVAHDPGFDRDAADDWARAVNAHMATERKPAYRGRKWFCERFGTPDERLTKGT